MTVTLTQEEIDLIELALSQYRVQEGNTHLAWYIRKIEVAVHEKFGHKAPYSAILNDQGA
jgi:hypothetical protein